MATWDSSSSSSWRSLRTSSLQQPWGMIPTHSTWLGEGSWGCGGGGQERAWGGRSLGLRHTHLLLSPFLNTPAHEALRTHPHGTTGMPAPGEIVFAAKLGCVNYSDNEFARCIRAGPPPAPHSAPSPVSLWSQPPPAPRPSRPCWQPLSKPLSRLIGSQMYFKYHSVQRQLLKTLSSHCR